MTKRVFELVVGDVVTYGLLERIVYDIDALYIYLKGTSMNNGHVIKLGRKSQEILLYHGNKKKSQLKQTL